MDLALMTDYRDGLKERVKGKFLRFLIKTLYNGFRSYHRLGSWFEIKVNRKEFGYLASYGNWIFWISFIWQTTKLV